MADKSKIEWTDATWNPIRGCSVVSEGCRHCYAMTVAARFNQKDQAYEGLAYRNESGVHWTGNVSFVEKHLEDPLRWKQPRRIFVNSMSDLFHESIPDEWIERIFAVILRARRHTFQILTKRPKRMAEFMTRHSTGGRLLHLAGEVTHKGVDGESGEWPPRHVRLGVSVEDQKTADERIPLLLETPTAVRWISAEPLLGPIDLSRWLEPTGFQCLDPDCVHWQGSFLSQAEQDDYELADDRVNTNGDIEQGDPICVDCGLVGTWTGYDNGLDWVVVGGESGPGARPMHPDWARSLRDQCVAAGVPFFFKQWGAWLPEERTQHAEWPGGSSATVTELVNVRVGKKAAGRLLDGRTWDEHPT